MPNFTVAEILRGLDSGEFSSDNSTHFMLAMLMSEEADKKKKKEEGRRTSKTTTTPKRAAVSAGQPRARVKR